MEPKPEEPIAVEDVEEEVELDFAAALPAWDAVPAAPLVEDDEPWAEAAPVPVPPATRLVAERNAEEALMAVPALDAPVFICAALPAAAVAFAAVPPAAVVELDDPEELVLGARMPRSRGAINIANRSALVVPVRRMVLTRVPFVTRVVRT